MMYISLISNTLIRLNLIKNHLFTMKTIESKYSYQIKN